MNNETRYVLQLMDVQQIAENAGVQLKKSEAKRVLNEAYATMCNTCESLLAEKAKELFSNVGNPTESAEQQQTVSEAPQANASTEASPQGQEEGE